MKQNGFTLIELLIVFAVSSLIIVALFEGWHQTNRIFKIATDMIDIDQRILVLQDRLEKDITGVCIPLYLPPKKKKHGEEKNEEREIQKKNRKQLPILEKVFYSTNGNDKNIEEVTFITTNPLTVYESTKPRMARVLYTLEQEEDDKNSFRLLRSESEDLSYALLSKREKTSGYVLVDGIKSLIVEYSSYPEEKGEAKKEGDKKELSQLIESSEWNSDERAASKKKKRIIIPQIATVTVELWHARKTRTFEYQFVYQILSDEDPQLPRIQTEKEKDKTLEVSMETSPHMSRFLAEYQEHKWAKGGER